MAKNVGQKVIIFALGWSSCLGAISWDSGSGGSWNTASNWNPATVPNAAGVEAEFSGGNPGNGETITLASSVTIGTLTIDNTNTVLIGAAATPTIQFQATSGNANITLSSGMDFTIGSNLIFVSNVMLSGGGEITVTGNISGAGGLTKGAGSIELAGANTFSGSVIVNSAGTLTISGTGNALPGGVAVSGGTLDIASGGNLGATTPLSISTGLINFNASSSSVGSLSGAGAGGIDLMGNTVTVNQSSNGTVSNNISGGAGNLTKAGSATLTLAGMNVYTGTTRIAAGTLEITDGNSIGSSTTLQIDDGATLRLVNTMPTITYTGGVTLSGSATMNSNGGDLSLDGQVIGSGTLIKTGLGKVELRAAGGNTYSGGTLISNGELFIANSDAALGTGTVTLQGGKLSTASDRDVANSFTLVSGILNVTGIGNTLTLSGVVGGSGNLLKEGPGTLTLNAANTYSGVTQIDEGTLSLSNAGGLGASSGVILSTATLSIDTAAVTFGGLFNVTGSGIIDTNANVLNLSGGITGTGSTLTKNGSGTLNTGGASLLGDLIVNDGVVNLASSNVAGDVTLTGGTLNFTAGNGLQSIGNLNGVPLTTLDIGSNTLQVNQSAAGALIGPFVGTGRLVKGGGATLTVADLSGFSGDLTVNSGTLDLIGPFSVSGFGNLSGLGGTINFVTGSPVVINQTGSRVFAGNISGTDTITKRGSAALALTGTSSFTGIFNVEVGTLVVDGSLTGATLFVDSILTGSGSLGDTTVNSGGLVAGSGQYNGLLVLAGGTVQPEPVSTLTVLGNYTQSAAGSVLNIGTVTLNSNRVVVGGVADITDGTLNVTAEGSCFEGQTYDILIASGGIVGEWSTQNYPPDCQFQLDIINGNQIARLTSLNTVLFIDRTIDPGNPAAVKAYFDCLPIMADNELTVALAAASGLDNAELNAALDLFHPGLFGAFELASLDIHTLMTKILAEQATCCRACPHNKKAAPTSIEQRGWVTSLGSFTDIDRYGQLRSYGTQSGGILAGYDICFPFCGVIGWTVGYQHTSLDWHPNRGSASINGLLSGLYFGYSSKYFTCDLELIGGGNFYDVERDIIFRGFSDQAKNNHNGVFFAPRIGIAADMYPSQEGIIRLFAAVNYDYLSQAEYSEGGALGLNLRVDKKVSHILRSELGIRFAANIVLETGCLYLFGSPSWVRKIPISNGRYRSKLREFIDEPCVLIVETFESNKDFVGIDLGFEYTFRGMVASLVYRGEFGHDYRVNQVEGRWQWSF